VNVKSLPAIRVGIIIISLAVLTPVMITADSWSVAPAYHDQVSGSTSLINMESFAMSSRLSIRSVGEDGIPAGVSYTVSVTPVNGSEAAIGTVKTSFRGSIMEGRGDGIEAARNEWRDTAMVSGSIVNFMKTFTYTSGITI